MQTNNVLLYLVIN